MSPTREKTHAPAHNTDLIYTVPNVNDQEKSRRICPQSPLTNRFITSGGGGGAGQEQTDETIKRVSDYLVQLGINFTHGLRST